MSTYVDTYDALIDTIELVTNDLEKCSIFQLTSKRHWIQKKVHLYGIRDTALYLIIIFLNTRKQYLNINDENSTFLAINCVIPQGLILGPLLFLIYINDMTNISNKVKILLFADDINLIFKCDNTIDIVYIMQEYLDILIEWLCINKLSINI